MRKSALKISMIPQKSEWLASLSCAWYFQTPKCSNIDSDFIKMLAIIFDH